MPPTGRSDRLHPDSYLAHAALDALCTRAVRSSVHSSSRCVATVAADHCVGYRDVHQLSRAPERGWVQLGTDADDASLPLVEDRIAPSSADEAGQRETNERVSQRSSVQDARIVDGNEGHSRRSVAEAVLLRDGGELVHGALARGAGLVAIPEHVASEDSSMGAHEAERELPRIEELDEKRT